MTTNALPAGFPLTDEAARRSPALLIDRRRLEENLQQMLAIAGGPERLCPHLKTHKMAELIVRQLELGIRRFKCATLREAEMAAEAGARDLVLAYQPVGPNLRWLIELARAFPEVAFSPLVDEPSAARALGAAAARAGLTFRVLLDLDIGQHRTGISPGPAAAELYRLLTQTLGLCAGGLHAYDGHLHERDLAARTAACQAAFAPVAELRRQLLAAGLPVPRVIAGGTPTFALHARRPDVECSPGTCVFWDAGYDSKLPDLPFQPAAWLLTRVVSKPGGNRLCLDLGHKAVASEMPHPRVVFPQIPDALAVAHSEEHLVVESAEAARWAVGDAVYGIPWHVCPTVALYAEALIVENGQVTDVWGVAARTRRLTVEPLPY